MFPPSRDDETLVKLCQEGLAKRLPRRKPMGLCSLPLFPNWDLGSVQPCPGRWFLQISCAAGRMGHGTQWADGGRFWPQDASCGGKIGAGCVLKQGNQHEFANLTTPWLVASIQLFSSSSGVKWPMSNSERTWFYALDLVVSGLWFQVQRGAK